MKNYILKSLIFILIIVVSFIIFISLFGIQTSKFNSLIETKSNDVSNYAKLGFKDTKIYLSISELNLLVKIQDPKILLRDNEIILSKFDLYLSLRSFLTSDFLIKKAELAFAKNDIKDLTKITNIFLPKILNKKLNKIFHKGSLEGELILPFNSNGKIDQSYSFAGKISNARINISKDFSIKNLTTTIDHKKNLDKSDSFEIKFIKGSIYELELADSLINLKHKNKDVEIRSTLNTKGKINFLQIKKIFNLFSYENKSIINIDGIGNLKTEINFDLKKNFKVKNLSYSTKGNIDSLELDINKKSEIIKKYLPNYNEKLILKDSQINLTKNKLAQEMELSGLAKIDSKFDSFKIKEFYDYKKNLFNILGSIDLTNSKMQMSKLNFIKKNGVKSLLQFDINFNSNNDYNLKKVKFSSGESLINFENLKLNNKFEVNNFKLLEIKTFDNGLKNNDFKIKKNENIIGSGDIFDAESLLKSLYSSDQGNLFSKKFKSSIKINFANVLTGTNDYVSDYSMIASIKDGAYNKLSLKGNFSKNEIIEMSIYQIDKDKKTLHVISDRARPFIKNFNFIEGFEGGKLEYESIISKKTSESKLIINDFKVSKVPALAKLLTLASLQGIADTLSGEGIRFDSFEMKTNSNNNVLNIEDALAMGPAVSILLAGYVEKGKVVSLRGTLVPATKLNSIIASIPLIGDILVGKKTGDGVVGVSFKMKGPPKNIKTSVNPIKTLTPRFIVRAVEKMKKSKEESK
jgi:hypothetical protein